MTHRFGASSSVLMAAIAGLLAPGVLAAQTQTAKATPAAATSKTWTLPRTPDGQPDLQGYWTSLSFTPMERPAKYGGREFLTEEEMAQVLKAGVQHAYE